MVIGCPYKSRVAWHIRRLSQNQRRAVAVAGLGRFGQPQVAIRNARPRRRVAIAQTLSVLGWRPLCLVATQSSNTTTMRMLTLPSFLFRNLHGSSALNGSVGRKMTQQPAFKPSIEEGIRVVCCLQKARLICCIELPSYLHRAAILYRANASEALLRAMRAI